jgi:prophage antirepressor-like protein
VDGEPHFVAADVAGALDLGNPRSSLALLDDDEKGVHTMDTPGGPQPMAIVNEPGLYSLIFRSRKPEAKAFKRWVTHDVIPQIRKTGSYSVPLLDQDPLAVIAQTHRQLGEAIAIAHAERERADRMEFHALTLEPAAKAWDELMEAHGDYDVAQAAQILNRDAAIRTGRDRLFDYMESIHWIYRGGAKRSWRAYQSQVDLGRLRLAPKEYDHPRTGERTLGEPQIRVTVKGLFELHKRLGGISQLDALMSEEVSAS